MALRQGGRLPDSQQHRQSLLGTRTTAVRELKVYLGLQKLSLNEDFVQDTHDIWSHET